MTFRSTSVSDIGYESGRSSTKTKIPLKAVKSAPPFQSLQGEPVNSREFGGWLWMRVNYNDVKAKTVYSPEKYFDNRHMSKSLIRKFEKIESHHESLTTRLNRSRARRINSFNQTVKENLDMLKPISLTNYKSSYSKASDSGNEEQTDSSDAELDRTKSTFSNKVKFHNDFSSPKKSWLDKISTLVKKKDEKTVWKKYWITLTRNQEIQFRKNEYDNIPLFTLELDHCVIKVCEKNFKEGLRTAFEIRFRKSLKFLTLATRHKTEVAWWQKIVREAKV